MDIQNGYTTETEVTHTHKKTGVKDFRVTI